MRVMKSLLRLLSAESLKGCRIKRLSPNALPIVLRLRDKGRPWGGPDDCWTTIVRVEGGRGQWLELVVHGGGCQENATQFQSAFLPWQLLVTSGPLIHLPNRQIDLVSGWRDGLSEPLGNSPKGMFPRVISQLYLSSTIKQRLQMFNNWNRTVIQMKIHWDSLWEEAMLWKQTATE